MQRGRGRGRGRNPNPARNTTRRGNRSNSQPTNSRRTGTAATRRSARLAELLNTELVNGRLSGHFDPPVNDHSMADVARPRAFGSRSVSSRHQAGNSRYSRSNRQTVSPQDIQYAMDIVVQPPPSAYAGYAINGTIIVRLRTINVNPDEAVIDSGNLVAIATLIPGPNSSVPTDPNVLNTLLIGRRRFSSIHPFSDDEADGSIASMDLDDGRGVGYMRFSELSIRQAGTYRIRITLIRVPNPSSDTPVASVTGGSAVQVVDSNPIVVQSYGATSNLAAYNEDDADANDGGWSDVLRTIQSRRSSR